MDGAADLLVEQDRADGPVDAEVRADPDLAEAARARRRCRASRQVVVAALGARADDLAVPERQLDAGDLDAARARRGW